jgi:hypothetical protein
LNRDIHDILDCKDWTRFSQLYHLAIKAECEVQGHRQPFSFRSNTGRIFQQHSDVDKSKAAAVAKAPSTTPSTTPTFEVSNLSPVQVQSHKKPFTPGASSSNSASIQCHRCKGTGHVSNECPSRHAFITTPDGNDYISASDEEDFLALATNLVADSLIEQEVDTIDSHAVAAGFPSLLMQRVLATQLADKVDTKVQRNNLFHMFLIVQERRVLTIIDIGSCNNLVSSDLVPKLGLTTHELRHSYHIQWFNNSGKAKVTHSTRIHFPVGSYTDYADFDVVPMEACSLLLERPWEYDKDVAHHVELILTLSCIRIKTLLCFLYHMLMLGNILKGLLKIK